MPYRIAKYDALDKNIVITESNEKDAILANLDKQLVEVEKRLQERER